ncbi:MAG: hypothetical protein AVDCRST_MAG91-901, partial [uncultured Sphingomonadaceae bacterium]
ETPFGIARRSDRRVRDERRRGHVRLQCRSDGRGRTADDGDDSRNRRQHRHLRRRCQLADDPGDVLRTFGEHHHGAHPLLHAADRCRGRRDDGPDLDEFPARGDIRRLFANARSQPRVQLQSHFRDRERRHLGGSAGQAGRRALREPDLSEHPHQPLPRRRNPRQLGRRRSRTRDLGHDDPGLRRSRLLASIVSSSDVAIVRAHRGQL